MGFHGEQWNGRLEEWLAIVTGLSRRRARSEVCSFPTNGLLDEYLNTIATRGEAEISYFLNLFVFDATTFGSDDDRLAYFYRASEADQAKMLTRGYYQRLMESSSKVHPGVHWALELLPDRPRQALQ